MKITAIKVTRDKLTINAGTGWIDETAATLKAGGPKGAAKATGQLKVAEKRRKESASLVDATGECIQPNGKIEIQLHVKDAKGKEVAEEKRPSATLCDCQQLLPGQVPKPEEPKQKEPKLEIEASDVTLKSDQKQDLNFTPKPSNIPADAEYKVKFELFFKGEAPQWDPIKIDNKSAPFEEKPKGIKQNTRVTLQAATNLPAGSYQLVATFTVILPGKTGTITETVKDVTIRVGPTDKTKPSVDIEPGILRFKKTDPGKKLTVKAKVTIQFPADVKSSFKGTKFTLLDKKRQEVDGAVLAKPANPEGKINGTSETVSVEITLNEGVDQGDYTLQTFVEFPDLKVVQEQFPGGPKFDVTPGDRAEAGVKVLP